MTRIVLQFLLLIGLAAALGGCTSVSYYAQSLNGHARIMAARKPVAKLIADPSTPDGLRAWMRQADAIRQYASDELDLPDNESYRSYADIGRDYATWVVFAAPEFSLAPKTWCFPVFGCVPYRGYFSREKAVATGMDLKAEGYDVHVSGATAYSTLGWSSDPLLSTMLARDETYLAALIFHELAHQRVYVDDDSGFNEAFAVSVETTGVKRWLKTRSDAAAIKRYEAGLGRNADFVALLAETKRALAEVYAGAAAPEAKRAAKAAAIEALRARYRRLRDGRWGGFSGFDGWIESPINNAKLAATGVYNDQVADFLRLFEACSGDYPRFYAAVARIGALPRGARDEALRVAKGCD